MARKVIEFCDWPGCGRDDSEATLRVHTIDKTDVLLCPEHADPLGAAVKSAAASEPIAKKNPRKRTPQRLKMESDD